MTVMPFSPEADLLMMRGKTQEPVLAVRREDKGPGERRAPLTPRQVASLAETHFAKLHEVKIAVESSDRRVFPDGAYKRAGASIVSSLQRPTVVLGVKEPDPARLVPGSTHLVFAHVTKGQPANMPLLRRMIKLGCTLVDYEQIADDAGRRLVFFGRHAGQAGAIDALWALGRRLQAEGILTPFGDIRLAHEYAGLDAALAHIRAIGTQIREEGLPPALRPVVFAIAGSGHVSAGAAAVLDHLRPHEIGLEELENFPTTRESRRQVFLARLPRSARYRRIGGGSFNSADYIRHPERYASAVPRYLDHITVFLNGTYWQDGFPRLINNHHLDDLWRGEDQPVLRVIADVTCDVGGSIEANVGATTPHDPVYVYSPHCRQNGLTRISGVRGEGPVLMTIDNLPAQIPSEASESFGAQLLPFVPGLVACDWTHPLNRLHLPTELRRAVIVHRGKLAPQFAYLEQSLAHAAA